MNDELNKFLSTADPLCAEHDSIVDELDLITTDRDIKAANLQLLVDKVLDYKELVDSAVGGPGHIDAYETERLLDDTVALARSLKQ